jgi:hypothetical protein
MKTQIICPNKNDPAWKTLVKAIGEVRSFIAFFRNGNAIPDATKARQLLNIKAEPGPKLTPPVAPVGTGTLAIQFRRAHTRKINAGIFVTSRNSSLHSRARLQTRCTLQNQHHPLQGQTA